MIYREQDVLRLARRWKNAKRSYLLVDPLQGKHVPVSPQAALAMMRSLGTLLLREAGDAGLLIGFAETATAISGAAALCFGAELQYLQTTRESCGDVRMLEFAEEHSHAVTQQIASAPLAALRTRRIIMIDDEISTGRTIENIIAVLRREFPALRETAFVIGSIICRLSEERRRALSEQNIRFVSLVPVADRDFESAVSGMDAEPPVMAERSDLPYTTYHAQCPLPAFRTGTNAGTMQTALDRFAAECGSYLEEKLPSAGRILLLGTEECMLPAMMTGQYLETHCPGLSVFTHATTRSPIGICRAEGYPCPNGVQLASFYEAERVNYLYNIRDYDAVVVVTDSTDDAQCRLAMQYLAGAFPQHCNTFYLIRG
ncbi:MAG: phosphoribosyltransferase domain-containing protein [Oscillospiraceae bacterium]|nr:phosphoribosyltransferase domain-containing protein [Oscillospiraceae bacterium]